MALRRLSQIALFIAVLSQTTFLTEESVRIANAASLPVLACFLFSLAKHGRVTLNGFVVAYCSLAIFWLLSLGWHSAPRAPSLSSYRSVVLIALFLLGAYHLCVHEAAHIGIRWGMIGAVFVNAVLMVGDSSISLFGPVWNGGRFQGTFENANGAALVFFAALSFAIQVLNSDRTRFTRMLAWTAVVLAPALILATASRKGLFLVIMAAIVVLPVRIVNLGWRKLIAYSCLILPLLIAVVLVGVPSEALSPNLDVSLRRYTKFAEFITGQAADGSVDERLFFISAGIDSFLEAPIVGHGYDAFEAFFGTYSHNNYIELAVNGGLMAIVLYYYIYFYIIRLGFSITDFEEKALILLPVFALLLIEPALVTYSKKTVLYVLLVSCVLAEEAGRSSRRSRWAFVFKRNMNSKRVWP